MATRKTIVELYKSGEHYRWRMRDFRNHKIIGASTEGYKRKVYAVRNLARVGQAYLMIDDFVLLEKGRVVSEAVK